MAAVTALDAAEYLIWLAKEQGTSITNLKLQKLLYYAQGWYLGQFDEKLFADQFEAWIRGPAIRRVYGHYHYVEDEERDGAEALPPPASRPAVPDEVADHLENIWDAFAEYSPFEMEEMTHQEPPWLNARGDLDPSAKSDRVISVKDMHRYFSGLVREAEDTDEAAYVRAIEGRIAEIKANPRRLISGEDLERRLDALTAS